MRWKLLIKDIVLFPFRAARVILGFLLGIPLAITLFYAYRFGLNKLAVWFVNRYFPEVDANQWGEQVGEPINRFFDWCFSPITADDLEENSGGEKE